MRFRALYADSYDDVLRFVQRRIHLSQAEDVAADAFLVAWRRLDEAPRRPGELRPWLFGIARNCLLNAVRGQGRRDALAVRVAEAGWSAQVDVGTDVDLVAQRVDLAAAWLRLSETDQEVLSLTVFEELTSPQAGQLLGITAATYRLRLLRARHALRRRLHGPEHPAAVRMETSS
jgi:RNA polymerase sigma-70 factor, ECF subfamily